jgi:Pectate lyase superfamily protein
MNYLSTIVVTALAMSSLQAKPEDFSAAPPKNASVPPIILKLSDGVMAGRSFSINGAGLAAAGVTVALALDITGQSPASPPTNAIYPAIIQTDKDGHFVVARLPAGSPAGVYDAWVANSQGWSACAKLNAARALFMSDYQAYNGLDIEVVGRNFDQSEFGGPTATQVRLNDGNGTTYNLPVKELNPYHLTFTVGNQPVRTYYVEVSSDNGVNWSRLASGQTLALLAAPPAGSDPLGLGVSWAKDFKWANVFNVTNYGANPNDFGDDTVAVQNAVNAAENSGGGVVYFPNGSYYLKNISLGAGVVLEGQDEYNTKIYYAGTGGYSFIGSKGSGSLGGIPQLQGVARISILLSNPYTVNLRPDVIMNLGDQWGGSVSDQTLRTANRLFIAGVNLDYPYNVGNSSGSVGRRGIGALWIGKERVLLKDNHFTGWGANNLVTFLNQYCILKNNRFEYSSGYVHDTATYLFYENNYIKIHPEYNQDSHGYFARADAYMAGNYVEGAGDASNVNNDGEALCTEVPGGSFNYGAVLSATSNSLTVATVIPLINPAVEYGNLSIGITLGTGLGQVKTVAAINTNTGVIALSQPFDVVPDTTSKFTLYAPLSWFTVYSNTLVNCTKGIWGFGNQYDGVFADNTSIDCNGAFIWSARSSNATTAQNCPDFFNRITRNIVIGFSRRSEQGGIGTYTGRFDGTKFYDVEVYATEMTDNSVSGNNHVAAGSGTEAPPYDGLYVSSYPFSTASDGTGTGDATETLIESNRLSNLPTGVTLTKCDYGQLVNGNAYDSSVLTFLNNSTGATDNTLITSNVLVSSTALPVIITQPQNQSALTNETPTFTVLADGRTAPFYQWRKNNVPISGANRASYTAPPVVLADNGSQFSVIVSNSAGSTISSNATLTVNAVLFTR